MQILRLDHLVLTVASIPTSIAFYRDVLGFEPREKDGRWSLHFGSQKINLHQVDHTFEPKAWYPTPGSGDVCFITEAKPEETLEELLKHGVAVERGPVEQNGALGHMISIYFRDPDQNLVEVAQYQ